MALSSECQSITIVEEEGSKEKTLTQPKLPSKGGWNAAIFVILVEMVERFAFYGLATNLITYLTNELKEPTATAAKNVNIWVGITSILPLFGAFVADSYLGRFNTILFASIIYCTGMGLVSISVSIVSGHYRKLLFFISLYTVAIGEAGHRPCVLTFAADQFGEETMEEKKTKSSFYNWWNLAIVVGATFANFGIVYVQDNVGWGVGFGLVAASMALALVIFVFGIKKFRKESPMGSPFTSIARVFVAAARKRHINETSDGFGVYCGNKRPHNGELIKAPKTLARTSQFRFLDKAMIMDKQDASSSSKEYSWRLCSQNQVEEVKLLFRLLPISLCSLMFHVVNSLLHTYFTKQAATMIRTFGPSPSSGGFKIPPASLQGIMGITSLIAIPLYERVFKPMARKFTRNPNGITVLQRIGVGLFLSILNMVTSGLVEAKRVGVAGRYMLLDNPRAEIPIRVWWLVPQYVICGLSNSFAVIGLQELFYDQMPPGMRSLGSAANLSSAGFGNFLSTAIISVVQVISSRNGGTWLDDNINRAHLDYFYYLIAGLSCLNLCAYMLFARGFLYKKFEGEVQEGEELSRLETL